MTFQIKLKIDEYLKKIKIKHLNIISCALMENGILLTLSWSILKFFQIFIVFFYYYKKTMISLHWNFIVFMLNYNKSIMTYYCSCFLLSCQLILPQMHRIMTNSTTQCNSSIHSFKHSKSFLIMETLTLNQHKLSDGMIKSR